MKVLEKARNAKRKRRIAVCLITVLLTLTVGCTGGAQSKNNLDSKSDVPAKSSDASSNSPTKPLQATKFGVIATPMPEFEAPPLPETVPVVFESGGKYGYMDSAGNVLLPAEYDFAEEFHNGVGRFRLDSMENGEEQFQWFDLSPNGKVAVYDAVGAFYQSPWLATATKDGKYGLVNTNFDEILPLEYDLITFTQEDTGITCYAIKGDSMVQIDLANKTIYSYEPYDDTKSNYADVIDIADYNVAIINSMVTVKGKSDKIGSAIPFPILSMVEFDVYEETEKVFTGNGKVVDGSYEGTLLLHFDGFDLGERDFFAVPSGQTVFPRPVTVQTDVAAYDETAKKFLADTNIENTPYTIGKVLTGDFLDSGETAALVQLSETTAFRESIWKVSRSEDEYKQDKVAVFSAILLLPDATKPLEYQVVSQQMRQGEKAIMAGATYLKMAAQLQGDSLYEVLLDNVYYEWGDYSVISLENK